MGTDIYIHIEHKSRKKKRFVYDFEAEGERAYLLFGVMAGIRGDYDALFEPRGLPKDVSSEIKEEYKEFGGHTPSWLTTEEFFKCLDSYYMKCTRCAGNSEKIVLEWLKEWLPLYYSEFSFFL